MTRPYQETKGRNFHAELFGRMKKGAIFVQYLPEDFS